MNQYHTCQSLESGTVIIEFKNTKYDPITTIGLMLIGLPLLSLDFGFYNAIILFLLRYHL
jgi:hypothetical protein